jgi:hypothetical protein
MTNWGHSLDPAYRAVSDVFVNAWLIILCQRIALMARTYRLYRVRGNRDGITNMTHLCPNRATDTRACHYGVDRSILDDAVIAGLISARRPGQIRHFADCPNCVACRHGRPASRPSIAVRCLGRSPGLAGRMTWWVTARIGRSSRRSVLCASEISAAESAVSHATYGCFFTVP